VISNDYKLTKPNLKKPMLQLSAYWVIKLEISGVAKDRDTLINYSSNLKTNDIFKDFNIPVSSFAKNKDIPFSFPLNVKIDKKDEK
jgi:hypothetical protein